MAWNDFLSSHHYSWGNHFNPHFTDMETNPGSFAHSHSRTGSIFIFVFSYMHFGNGTGLCSLPRGVGFLVFSFIFLERGWVGGRDGSESGEPAGQAEACSMPEVLADTFSSSHLVQKTDKIRVKHLSAPTPSIWGSITASRFLTNSPTQFLQFFSQVWGHRERGTAREKSVRSSGGTEGCRLARTPGFPWSPFSSRSLQKESSVLG